MNLDTENQCTRKRLTRNPSHRGALTFSPEAKMYTESSRLSMPTKLTLELSEATFLRNTSGNVG